MMSAILFGFVHATKGKTPKKHTSARFSAVFVAIPLYSVLPSYRRETESQRVDSTEPLQQATPPCKTHGLPQGTTAAQKKHVREYARDEGMMYR
jgi:hypothetical protein